MRSFIAVILTLIAIAILGPLGCMCLAAIPDLTGDALRAAATHIIAGGVQRIYTSVEWTTADWETAYCVAEIRVDKVEKGRGLGRIAYVRFWTRRYVGAGLAPPGDYGHRGIPKSGDTLRVFVAEAEDGGFDVLAPNGFVAAASTK
jgi:hypothetical protein